MINSSIRLHFQAVSRPERGNRLVGNLVTTGSAVDILPTSENVTLEKELCRRLKVSP